MERLAGAQGWDQISGERRHRSHKRSGGKLVGFAKITRDLTERRATEASLRRSQEQFRRLVEGVTDYSIFLLEPDGRVATWNAGAQRIKGYRPEEIIGQHFSRFYTEEDRENREPDKALETATREGRFKRKVGASARTASASGLTSSSIQYMTVANSSDLPRSLGTLLNGARPNSLWKRLAKHYSSRKRWMRSDN